MLYTLKLCLFFGVLLRAMSSVLPSLNFVGRLRFRLRLQVVKVPEPTQAPSPTYLGRLWLQAKKCVSRWIRLWLHTVKLFIMSS